MQLLVPGTTAPLSGSVQTIYIVAPSISSQFTYAKLGQVITGLRELGFHTVIEAALGADMKITQMYDGPVTILLEL